jgi:type I restriction enzyme S subunit
MDEWRRVPLGDVLQRITYGFTNPMPTTADGPIMVTAKDIREGRIDYRSARFTSREAYDTLLTDKSRPHVGDVLLTKDGSIGRVAVCDRPDICINQSVALLQLNELVDSRFLAYMLQASDYQQRMAADADGSTIKHIYITRVDKMEIDLPPLGEQEAIAEVLGALDDKIAANERVAGLSLEVADAFYLSEEARTSARSLVGDVAVTVLGGTPSRSITEYWTNGTVPWIASGKANELRVLEPTEWITEEALARSAAKMMPKKATILAITGATLGQVARLEMAVSGNQSLVGIWHEDPAANDWLYFAVRHEISELLKHATGAAQQHVNKAAVDGLLVPWPEKADLDSWGARVRPLLDAAAFADRESLVLARTRDELLPLLMSGRVRVKDGDRTVERVQ